MAKKRKTKLTACKVTLTSHPRAPWRVSYPVEVDGVTRRKRRMFSTEERAMAFAAEHEKDVADYGVRFGSITAEARRAFDFYRDARAELRAEIEVPTFEALVMDAVANLRQAHADRQRARVTVAEAVEAFIDYKRARVGERHLEGLTGQLKRFARDFGTDPLDRVTSTDVETWVCSLRSPRADESGNRPLLGPTSRNKFRKSLKALFAYGLAPARAWCHRNPLSDVEPEKVTTGEPEAYTPDETARIMQTALAMDSPIMPALALQFFAGLRPSETMAMDLGVINLEADGFRIPAGTKTGARIAPLTAACRAWLAAQSRRKGLACPCDRQGHSREMRALLEAAGVKGIYDGPRHSFITHRTAETRDVARVADECGNSPNIIKKHYRELVTGDIAERYFAIRPEAPAANILPMEGRASA